MQIQDRVALVTGGASGLGAAAVRRFVQAGARAAIIDRDQDRGRQMAEQLGNAVIHCPCDVSDEEQVVAAIDKTIEAFGQIDVLLNAAGIGGSIRTVTRDGPHPLDHFKKVVGINLIGTFSVLSQCASRMVNNEPDADGCRGVIVNTSSIAAFDGQIGQVAYSASKGGLVGMTLPIARDLASLGIRCCTICPGIRSTTRHRTKSFPFPSMPRKQWNQVRPVIVLPCSTRGLYSNLARCPRCRLATPA